MKNNFERYRTTRKKHLAQKQLQAILSAAFLTVLLVTAIAIMSLVGGA